MNTYFLIPQNPFKSKLSVLCCSYSSDGKTVDLINIEFAKVLQDSKFHLDHRAILCKSKTIGNVFYRDPHLKSSNKGKIRAHCIQITGIESQVVYVELVDNGLYVARKLGSLRLPACPLDLKMARVLLERLYI
jgi:hypothetical protein